MLKQMNVSEEGDIVYVNSFDGAMEIKRVAKGYCHPIKIRKGCRLRIGRGTFRLLDLPIVEKYEIIYDNGVIKVIAA